jgi:3-oxoacyl-[acyl-carrier protein] reductase
MICALITGGSKGIGKAIAKCLSEEHKMHILINYSSNADEARKTMDEIIASGGSAEILQFPVQHAGSVKSSLESWIEQNPEKQISVLINNAGIAKDGLFIWMSEENWDEVMAVSLKGMYNVTQAVIRHMMANKYGRIINIASISGMKGVAGQTNYSAAKAGLIGATKALAQEVSRLGITVNAVAPGFINTEMTEDLNAETFKKLIPAGRFGEPGEVASLVSFLASEKSAYITGEVININGGLYS